MSLNATRARSPPLTCEPAAPASGEESTASADHAGLLLERLPLHLNGQSCWIATMMTGGTYTPLRNRLLRFRTLPISPSAVTARIRGRSWQLSPPRQFVVQLPCYSHLTHGPMLVGGPITILKVIHGRPPSLVIDVGDNATYVHDGVAGFLAREHSLRLYPLALNQLGPPALANMPCSR